MTIRTIDSKPSIAMSNGSDHIFYSKYGKTHSDIYAIPIVEVEEQINVFGYSDDIADTGVVVTDPDERARLMKLNLSPYRKTLNSELVIRYLYTGREYNVETGDYYYRARIVDPEIGRYTGKDSYFSLNRYFYTDDDPVNYTDPMGLWTLSFGLRFDFGFLGGAAGTFSFAIGHSKECGFTSGSSISRGGGVTLGATAATSLNLNFTLKNKSVNDLGGISNEMSLSFGNIGFAGGGISINEKANLGLNLQLGLGFGAAYTNSIMNTDVYPGSKGKCN